ncbi:MAG: hypothetical protein LBB27_00180 [Tannerellaceae bacterium]|jgi:hypothetical protein|nr:hypothetical protein [Tannerellaceae bacterium]
MKKTIAFLATLALIACENSETPVIDAQTSATPPPSAHPVLDKDFTFMWDEGFRKITEDIDFDFDENITETFHNGMSADTITLEYSGAKLASADATLYLADGAVITLAGNPDNAGYIPYVSSLAFAYEPVDISATLHIFASVNDGPYTSLPDVVLPDEVVAVATHFVAVNLSNVRLRIEAEIVGEPLALHRLAAYGEGLPEGSVVIAEEQFDDPDVWPLQEFPATLSQTVRYGDFDVLYDLVNADVDPTGDNHHGDNSLVTELTAGYIGLPAASDATLTFGPFPAVALAELWFSSNGMRCDHEISCRIGDGEFQVITHYVTDRYAGIGKYLRVPLPEVPSDVTFRIRSAHPTAKTKLHGFRIWK